MVFRGCMTAGKASCSGCAPGSRAQRAAAAPASVGVTPAWTRRNPSAPAAPGPQHGCGRLLNHPPPPLHNQVRLHDDGEEERGPRRTCKTRQKRAILAAAVRRCSLDHPPYRPATGVMKGFRPPEPSCSTMLARGQHSIETCELACQAHRNHSFWEPRTPRQLAVYKPSSSVGWSARDPATRQALP